MPGKRDAKLAGRRCHRFKFLSIGARVNLDEVETRLVLRLDQILWSATQLTLHLLIIVDYFSDIIYLGFGELVRFRIRIDVQFVQYF